MADSDSENYLNSKKNFKPTKTEDYGYFFFPERFGNIHEQPWYKKLVFFGASREGMRKVQCETNVENCLKSHPGVKMMVESMRKLGCEPKLLRHFSCEFCETDVLKGGFDPTTNQVIVCYNNVSPTKKEDVAESMIKSLIQSFDYCRAKYDMFNLKHLACTEIILCYNNLASYNETSKIVTHELIHAFDTCRAHLDPSNNHHVACTEIRAANLTPCSIKDAVDNHFISMFNFKNKHKQCVRMKAALSLQMVRNITAKEAIEIVDSVFDKCVNDTEPFNRSIYSNYDYERSYEDRYKYDSN